MAANVLTTTATIAPEFPAAYYKTQFLKEMAKKSVFYEAAMKQPLPPHNGKTVQFRLEVPYTVPAVPAALSEGTPPAPLSPTVNEVLIGIKQYGDYTAVSDLASFTAVDDIVASEIDKITRLQHEKIEILSIIGLKLASHAVYAADANGTVPTSMAALTSANVLTSLELRKAVRFLKKKGVEPYYRNGKPYFRCIANPDSTFMLQDDDAWRDVSTYQNSEAIYNGEIGRLFGCIITESPFPIDFTAADLIAAARNLTVKTTLQSEGKTVEIKETITAAEATALAGRKVFINGTAHTIASAHAANGTITTKENVSTTDAAANKLITPGEGGALGASVQGAVVFGAKAFGAVDLEAGSNIVVYANESGGPTDPLHQMRTVGVKINGFGTGIVNQDHIVMIKTGVAA